MTPTAILLPPDITITFFAEGAANIVYRLSPATSTPFTPPIDSETDIYSNSTPPPSEIELPLQATTLPPPFKHKLLRLRKKQSTTTPLLEAQTAFEEVIKPLFKPEQLVEQVLVTLPEGLSRKLNAELRAMEEKGTRKEERRGVFLDEEEGYGLLVSDMSPQGYEGEGECVCVEFKPKWLAMSPSAPEEAKRCRTCALRAMREANGKITKGGFCPYDLVGSRADVSIATDSILKAKWGKKPGESLRGGECWIHDRIVDVISGGNLLGPLRNLQIDFDREGMFGGKVEERDFLTAMTLRDCTLYIRVPPGDEPLEARLGDLDLKSPAKASSWIAQERQLVDECWYTGDKMSDAQKGVLCALQRDAREQSRRSELQKKKPNPRKRRASPSIGNTSAR
ncbi:Inositol-pentakisphosphate 2-kinase [Trapelia coarctata]|nr:Inositol-pentakisphosphate 2-kinase [Trapelia coarctata]